MPPLSHCKQTQVEMDTGVGWIQSQRALVARYCFGGASQAVKYIPHRHERVRKFWLDSDGSLVAVQGALVFASAIIEIPQIEMGCRIVRVARNGRFVCGASLINPRTCKQNVAAVQVCSGASRVRLDGGIVTRHCLSDPSLVLQCISFIDQCACGVLRVDRGAVGNRRTLQSHASPREIAHLWPRLDCALSAPVPQVRLREGPLERFAV